MVYLSRIYTKSGDKGDTGLGDGSRVPKDHPRVAAYGSTDELNAVIGLLVADGEGLSSEQAALLRSIQNDLFDLGADLCLPESEDTASALRVREEQVTRLENEIDRCNEHLQPLRSFVLPGGSRAAAWCHLARTVCRRAERELVTLMRTESINPNVLMYLNRLSDYLFVLSRALNENGANDVLWAPGQSVGQAASLPEQAES
jgi:cob(I)alamin adenosyltransferase